MNERLHRGSSCGQAAWQDQMVDQGRGAALLGRLAAPVRASQHANDEKENVAVHPKRGDPERRLLSSELKRVA